MNWCEVSAARFLNRLSNCYVWREKQKDMIALCTQTEIFNIMHIIAVYIGQFVYGYLFGDFDNCHKSSMKFELKRIEKKRKWANIEKFRIVMAKVVKVQDNDSMTIHAQSVSWESHHITSRLKVYTFDRLCILL